MLQAFASGLLLGLTCGLVPGPLLTLVLSQSLRHGPREGCKVALVPLITDAPVIVAALALAYWGAGYDRALGVLSLAGAGFVAYLAVDTFRPPRLDRDARAVRPQSLLKGVATNLLSPNPWLFWLTTGVATLAQAMTSGWFAVAVFLAVFYFLLVGSKLLVALAAGWSRGFLGGRAFRVIMAALGVLLAGFAVVLLRAGLKYLALL